MVCVHNPTHGYPGVEYFQQERLFSGFLLSPRKGGQCIGINAVFSLFWWGVCIRHNK